MPLVYLVSGANRGIGLGLVEALASRTDTVVFAGARDPSAASALNTLAKTHVGKVHVLTLSSGDAADNAAAVEKIREVAGRLDVVIANAGIAKSFDTVVNVPVADVREHWEVNAAGPLTLFQHTFPLLRSSDTPKFVVITSGAGSMGLMSVHSALPAYGSSKAAVNYITRAIHFDVEAEKAGLVAFPICPGPVETDMASKAKEVVPGLINQLTFRSVADSCARLLEIIDGATREETGGKYMQLEGTHPW